MTQHACVIGWPISHSKSPLIHSYWLRQYGVDGVYDKVAVKPDRLAQFVQDAWDYGLAGFNATIPHKTELMGLVAPDKTAQQIGAINTVYRGETGWVGTNTDALGWLMSLNLTREPKRALVIGAGGAAKAIVYALKALKAQTTITNRTASALNTAAWSALLVGGIAAVAGARGSDIVKAAAAGGAFGAAVETIGWLGRSINGRGYDLIVNTSACGMNGENPLTLTHLDPGTLVSDLVYTPLETQLLKSARDLGGVPIDGLGMLLHQAAGGFEKWFGVRPEVTPELRQAVLSV